MLYRSIYVLAMLMAGASGAPSESTKKACRDISNALPKRVSTSISVTYLSELHSYWSVALREVKPACMVFPQSAAEVASTVKILGEYSDVEFAVKSGGHSPNDRHSSIEDGVLISTKDLAGVSYDKQKGLAYVKPGGEWNDVVGPLDEQGVTVVGGRLGT